MACDMVLFGGVCPRISMACDMVLFGVVGALEQVWPVTFFCLVACVPSNKYGL